MKANNRSFIDNVLKLTADLENMLSKAAAVSPKPKKNKPDREILSKLLAACQHYNMDDIDAAMEEIENFDYNSDDGLALWLRDNVDQMNFAQIIEKLLEENK
ncbi:MAG: hypothetical protein LBH44_07920 [Treponema sp.]|nr:hypothetical protein [Treponema sp.]